VHCGLLGGVAGLRVADPAGRPSRLVPPSGAARGVTTRSGLQDTHRTPTGSGLTPRYLQQQPARCGSSGAGRGGRLPVIDTGCARCRLGRPLPKRDRAAGNGGVAGFGRHAAGSSRWQARGCRQGSRPERGDRHGPWLAGSLRQSRAWARLTRWADRGGAGVSGGLACRLTCVFASCLERAPSSGGFPHVVAGCGVAVL